MRVFPVRTAAPGDPAEDRSNRPSDDWLHRFRAGNQRCLEACYRDHFALVDGAVASVVGGADRETLVHEVFFRLLSDESLRHSFRGGSFAAWLKVVARNQAIDYARRRRLELRFADEDEGGPANSVPPVDGQVHARLTLERFREQLVPAKWRRVFDARFLAQQDQPTAARALGMKRTTLAYQEYRIRRLLHRFVLRGDST